MRCLLVLAAVGGCDDQSPGASVVVDGSAVELPQVSVMRLDTFYMLSAASPEGASLELGFPTAAQLGDHTCEEGRIAGLVTMTFTSASGQRFSSVYPSSAPTHRCSFRIDELGETTALSALGGMLSDMPGAASIQLANGSFLSVKVE